MPVKGFLPLSATEGLHALLFFNISLSPIYYAPSFIHLAIENTTQ
jgi:hypothetical protein